MFFDSLFNRKDLWTAARRGDTAAIEQLVRNGHDVNAKKRSLNVEGSTPLHIAAAAGQIEAIKALVELGAQVDARDDWGGTPLMDAVTDGRSAEAAKLLLDCGADINHQDRHGNTALDYAAFDGNEQLTAFLLRFGANPNQKKGRRKSEVLTKAIEGKNSKVFEMLIAAGAKPGCTGDIDPAINVAALYGRHDFVEQLLLIGADPNSVDQSSFPAVICAVRGGDLQVLQALVNAGANVNVANSERETALDTAHEIKRKDMIELLDRAGAKRGRDLPKGEPPDSEASWQLQDDSVVSACVEPWPPTVGNAVLKVSVCSEPRSVGSWSIQYRICSESESSTPWVKMFPVEEDNESDTEEFEVRIDLKVGTWSVHLRVSGPMHKEAEVLADWKIIVQ